MAIDDTSTIRDLTDLLARQKDAVRRGDILALSLLSEPMIEQLGRLVRLPAGDRRSSLDRLKGQAEENQRLLGAALKGIQSASVRLREIAGVAGELRTYDSRGQSASVSFAPGTMERRA
ncbi:MAG: hypothetical protein WBB85_11225 [Albidovulum sp.]|uniref:hypothetical protein n=1 Tax=Albidovulum sp. TaxID=1872424 RepID=UPI003CA02C44